MRVLALTQTYPLSPGDSTAPFMGEIVQALAARSHLVDVLLPAHPKLRQQDTNAVRFVTYRYSPLASWAPWGFGASITGASRIRGGAAILLPAVVLAARSAISRQLRRHRYDVVHAHWSIPNGWLASGPCRANRVPLVISLHGSDISLAERNRLFARLNIRAFAAAAAVTASSDDLVARAVRVGADAALTTTVHYGVDTDVFRPGRGDVAFRAQLGAEPGKLLVVAVGRLAEVKGFEYLIDATAGLDSVRVAIVGDGDSRPHLEELVRSRRAPVTFIGNLPHDGVADALSVADLVVVPSVPDRRGRIDGLPNTVLEAMASATPVVATRIGGIPEVITHERNGLLVPPRDSNVLREALQRLAADPVLRERLGNSARAMTLESLGWSTVGERFEEVFEAVSATVPANPAER